MTIKRDKAALAFMLIVALSGLALGLSDSVMSNYFYDAYNVDAFQRGLIEFPREIPGVISVVIVSGLAFLGNIRLAIIAHVLSIIGIFVLGLASPPFMIMLIFLFINSLGMHMFFPIYDSMAMSLAKKDDFGTTMGRFNGLRTGFTMVAAIIVFLGFRSGVFSFTSPVITIFVIAGALFTVILGLLIFMGRQMEDVKAEKPRFVLNRAYSKFYLLAILFGARKQIMYVYGPWVLIELLSFGADRMALLIIAGSAIGIFFLPAVGRWIDRFGPGKIMIIEAALFLVIYLGYGLISIEVGSATAGLSVAAIAVLAVVVNIVDRMTIQFGMVRPVYMRSIAKSPEDVTPTLATGMALDHVVSIGSAIFSGFLWWEFGPQYVFVFAGLLALANMLVAVRIKKDADAANQTDVA